MDFTFTEAQHDLSGLARRLLTDWSERTKHPDPAGFDRALWTDMARAGLLDAALPSTVGGGGFGLLEQCSVLIEIGRTVAAAPYLGSITVAAAAIAEFGDRRQFERCALPVIRGEATIAAAPADDAVAGFRAERAENGWRATGSRPTIAAGAFADTFLVEADTTEGALLLLVDANTPGVRVTEQHVVDGTDAVLLELDDVVLTADAALGAPGDGAAAWARRRAALGWCARQLGVLERALEMTGEYAKSRKQFDKPIGSFQAVRQRLAEAYLDVEAVRLSLWQAAWREAEGLSADAEIATATFWAAEAGHRVAHTAVHVHGGVGIDIDYPLHRYFVAAKRAEFSLGGATAQLRRLGTLLAEEPA